MGTKLLSVEGGSFLDWAKQRIRKNLRLTNFTIKQASVGVEAACRAAKK